MELTYFLFFIIVGSNFSTNIVDGLKVEQIIGGKVALLNQFKYAVAVMYKSPEENLTDQNPCTGSIIHDWFVITVAHCFYNRKSGTYINKEFYVAVSLLNLKSPTPRAKYIGVNLVIMPNIYDHLTLDTYSTIGNLAVIKLQSNLGLRRGHQSLRKLRISRDQMRGLNRTYIVAGFGWNEVTLTITEENYLIDYVQSGQSDGQLRYAHVTLLEKIQCQKIIEDSIGRGNMCAYIRQALGEHKGICQGDSGSPLIYSDYLIGVAINGFAECDESKKPGIYINIPMYYEFVTNVLLHNKTSNMRIIQLQRNFNIYEFKEISTIV